MRKKKSGQGAPRTVIFFLTLAALAAFGVWQRQAVVSFARNLALVRRAPDALAALRSLSRTTFGVLCVGDRDSAEDCFVFDEDGLVWNGARTVVGEIVRVSDRSGHIPPIGSSVIDADSWRFIAPIIRFARDERLDIADFILKRDEREIDIVLVGGPMLRFSYEFDPAQHLRALPVLREKVPFDSLALSLIHI